LSFFSGTLRVSAHTPLPSTSELTVPCPQSPSSPKLLIAGLVRTIPPSTFFFLYSSNRPPPLRNSHFPPLSPSLQTLSSLNYTTRNWQSASDCPMLFFGVREPSFSGKIPSTRSSVPLSPFVEYLDFIHRRSFFPTFFPPRHFLPRTPRSNLPPSSCTPRSLSATVLEP